MKKNSKIIIPLKKKIVESQNFEKQKIIDTIILNELRVKKDYIKIAYLAPFPDMWTIQGVNPGSGIMRKISGIVSFRINLY